MHSTFFSTQQTLLPDSQHYTTHHGDHGDIEDHGDIGYHGDTVFLIWSLTLATSWPPVVEGSGGRLSLETLRTGSDGAHGASSSACDTCE